jgi:hypothetical protein
MSGAQNIEFSSAQVCQILGVTTQQLRAWRPATRCGFERTRFTLPDLVGLAVLSELADRLALDVRSFRAGIDQLFATLGDVADIQTLDACVAVLGPNRGVVLSGPRVSTPTVSGDCFAVPLHPILVSLRDYAFA